MCTLLFICVLFLLQFFKFNTAKTVSIVPGVVSGVVSSLVIILLLVIAIVIAVVCVKRNRHKEQSSDNRNDEMDEHYSHLSTSYRFSQEATPIDVYRSLSTNSQQITSVQSESETPIYNNVNKKADDNTTSSEQQIQYFQPFSNINYAVPPDGPSITV